MEDIENQDTNSENIRDEIFQTIKQLNNERIAYENDK